MQPLPLMDMVDIEMVDVDNDNEDNNNKTENPSKDALGKTDKRVD